MRKQLPKLFVILIGLFFILSGIISANHFDNTGISARITGLGYTFVGIADDPTTLYWNPAGIVDARGFSATITNPYRIPGYQLTNISFTTPFKAGYFGLMYSAESANLLSWEAENQYKNVRIGFGIGGQPKFLKDVDDEFAIFETLLANLNLGATIWHTDVKNGDEKFSELSIDLGLKLEQGPLGIGFALRNMFSEELNKVSLGVSWLWKDVAFFDDLRIASDLSALANDYELQLESSYGLEATLNEFVKVRIGGSPRSILRSVGLGLKSGAWLLDYSYSFHEVGNNHNLSVGSKF